jgi:hypothetical protein
VRERRGPKATTTPGRFTYVGTTLERLDRGAPSASLHGSRRWASELLGTSRTRGPSMRITGLVALASRSAAAPLSRRAPSSQFFRRPPPAERAPPPRSRAAIIQGDKPAIQPGVGARGRILAQLITATRTSKMPAESTARAASSPFVTHSGVSRSRPRLTARCSSRWVVGRSRHASSRRASRFPSARGWLRGCALAAGGEHEAHDRAASHRAQAAG